MTVHSNQTDYNLEICEACQNGNKIAHKMYVQHCAPNYRKFKKWRQLYPKHEDDFTQKDEDDLSKKM